MIIIKNNTPNDVNMIINGVAISAKSKREILVDSVIGEILRERQPQLSYFEVPMDIEDEEVKRFAKMDKKYKDDEKERALKEKEQIEEMNKIRKKMADKKAEERALKKDVEKPKSEKAKVVDKKPSKLNKITNKKNEKK